MKKDLLLRASIAWLIAAQSAIPVHAQSGQQPTAAEGRQCPALNLRPPKYPMAMAKAGRGGHGIVSVAYDDCGRVTDARIAKTTGSAELDKASLDAALTWTLGKPKPDWKLVDGRYEAPVDFLPPTEVKTSSPKQLGWPKTHRRPRYELDSASGTVPSFAEANSLISKAFMQGRMAPPVYGRGVFVATGNEAAPEFWFQDGTLAARYRPVMDNGEAVVKVAIVCAPAQPGCMQREAELLKGLPFAKAKN